MTLRTTSDGSQTVRLGPVESWIAVSIAIAVVSSIGFGIRTLIDLRDTTQQIRADLRLSEQANTYRDRTLDEHHRRIQRLERP